MCVHRQKRKHCQQNSKHMLYTRTRNPSPPSPLPRFIIALATPAPCREELGVLGNDRHLAVKAPQMKVAEGHAIHRYAPDLRGVGQRIRSFCNDEITRNKSAFITSGKMNEKSRSTAYVCMVFSSKQSVRRSFPH